MLAPANLQAPVQTVDGFDELEVRRKKKNQIKKWKNMKEPIFISSNVSNVLPFNVSILYKLINVFDDLLVQK